MRWGPAGARGDGGLVEFALEHVLRASVVKTEDLVVDVKPVHDETEAMSELDAALRIKLQVGIEVIVAEWTGRAISIASDIGSVIGEPNANRHAAAIVGGADVPGVRRVAHKPRMIGATEVGTKGRARSRVTVVCRDSETREGPGQECEVLQVSGLETIDPCAAGVHWLSDPTCCRRRASRTTKGSCSDIIKCVGNDGVGQVFVKISGGNDSEGVQVVLKEQIDVIRQLGF